VYEKDGTFELKESIAAYNDLFGAENESLRSKNSFIWNDFDQISA